MDILRIISQIIPEKAEIINTVSQLSSVKSPFVNL